MTVKGLENALAIQKETGTIKEDLLIEDMLHTL